MTSSARILIVDDQPMNVEILEELLDDYVVESAFNGPEALAKVESFQPHLILLDVMMPGMSGHQVCQSIRSEAGYEGTIVVFLSARAQQSDIQEGYNAGGDDYVTKPFDPMALVDTIEEHLNRDSQSATDS